MTTLPRDPENFRTHVAALQSALDGADAGGFRLAFDALCDEMHSGLLPELKRVTATAQSALERFSAEARLDALAGHEVPDARKRLTHVVNLTDEAAHNTLDLVEKCGPLVDAAARGSAELLGQWSAFSLSNEGTDSQWPQRASDFLERTRTDSKALRGYLSELLMAQGYQDITGQIIRSVIHLVGELEQVLGQLVEIANGGVAKTLIRVAPSTDWNRGLGPQVSGIVDASAVSDQDDIDALLLGMAGGK